MRSKEKVNICLLEEDGVKESRVWAAEEKRRVQVRWVWVIGEGRSEGEMSMGCGGRKEWRWGEYELLGKGEVKKRRVWTAEEGWSEGEMSIGCGGRKKSEGEESMDCWGRVKWRRGEYGLLRKGGVEWRRDKYWLHGKRWVKDRLVWTAGEGKNEREVSMGFWGRVKWRKASMGC